MPVSEASATSIADARPERGVRLRRLAAAAEARFEAERDQLPLWLPVGLGAGIAAWFVFPGPLEWLAFLAGTAGLAIAAVACGPGTRWGRAAFVFLLAAASGCALAWGRAQLVEAPRLERPRVARFHAEVERVERIAAKDAVRLLVAPRDGTLPPRLRVNVPEDKAPGGLAPGATVDLRAWLMPPPPAAVPGAYDFSRSAWFRAIGGTGRALDIRILAAPSERSFAKQIAEWRQRLVDHVRTRVDGGAGGIAAALATGDQGGIEEADAEAMRRSGLAHLLSISGLHVTALVGAVMLVVLRLLALSPTLALRFPLFAIAAGAGALAGVAYTLLTGSEVPTVRACIASVLVLAAIVLGREALTLRLVAAGALLVLLLWPESLVGASFQLSFAAITAIVALHEHPRVRAFVARRDESLAARLLRLVATLLLTGLVVEIALMPIALYHFHKAGLYGALANIIAIPLTTFVVMPLEAAALFLDLFDLGAPFWWATGQSLSFLLRLAHAAADAPGSVAMLPVVPVPAFALMLAGGIWICLWRSGWRAWGIAPLALGAAWAVATPAPDLLITGDGRHVALRTASGEVAILRGRAGDYVRDLMRDNAGTESEPIEIESLPLASCSRDLCAVEITKEGRRWRLLATRSVHLVDIVPLVRACAAADIVVSDRSLPRTCRPRWLKADRRFLARSGGLALTLGERPSVRSVGAAVGAHPWAIARD